MNRFYQVGSKVLEVMILAGIVMFFVWYYKEMFGVSWP